MKKVILWGGIAVVLLSGCSGYTLKYEGKNQPWDEVEEQIEDKLEAENIGIDLEVDITQETEKSKKKKKK